MNKNLVVFAAALCAAFTGYAQQQVEPRATGTAWVELFGGQDGAIIYPQYSWAIRTAPVKFEGYGFLESAPHELLYQNNHFNATATQLPWLSLHVEVGGFPGKDAWFTQVGPRFNVHAAMPKLAKVLPTLTVAYLPKLAGNRGANLGLVATTAELPLAKKCVTIHEETFNYTYEGFNYGELWTVASVKNWKHVNPIVHLIWDTSRTQVFTVTYGFRFTP